MRPPRLLLAIIVSLAALLAAGLAVVSADESIETNEPVDPAVVILRPGENLVGWLGEPLPVAQLKRRIPAIESVSAWEPLTAEFYEPTSLSAGQGYIVKLAGTESVQWRRPMTPVKGKITLHRGRNLVTWLGPDDWTIEDVAKGIGVSLVKIQLGDHSYEPSSPETASDWPEVHRGDVLHVTVARDLIWLLPTFVMPKVHYAGNVSPGFQKDIERDLTATLEYSAREFGIQADPFSMVVVVASGAKAAHGKIAELGRQWEWESFKNFWQRASGWYMSDLDVFVLKTSAWEGYRSGRYYWGRYAVLHEYVHALQCQLAGKASALYPKWLLEGSANWFDTDLSTLDRNGYPLSRHLIDALNQASKGPPLEEIESRNKTWQYSFGLVAANLLIERSDKSAVFDFYRTLAPGRAGPAGHWTTEPTIRSAFVAAFGMTLDEFYEEFEALMAKRRGSARRRPAGNEVTLTGTIVNSDGTPRVDAALEAREYKDGYPAGWNRRARSSEDGSFDVFLRKRASYRIWIELGDHQSCRFWWSTDSDLAQPSDDEASVIEVEGSQPEQITITVDADRCRWRISGALSGPDDEPLAGIEVRAEGNDSSSSVRTELDGSFTLITTEPGSYRVSTDLGGCVIDWRDAEHAEAEEQTSLVYVLDSDIVGINFRVLEDPCTRITGLLLDSNGNGIDGIRVNAKTDGEHVRGRTDAGGRFHLALSEPGEYWLYAFIDGCRIYYFVGGATGVYAERALITVSERDVNDVVIQLQDDMCQLRISGTLSNADGTPKAGVWVNASGRPGYGGDWPTDDGTFSFIVTAAGTYKLRITIDGCHVFYAGAGTSGSEAQAHTFNLTSHDVTGIEFRLPEDPASFCD